MKEQANSLLNAPDPKTLTGLRDRAILALLLGCGLRRAELLGINLEDLQQRKDAGCCPTWKGRVGASELFTVPTGVKSRIDAWLKASGITKDRLFRPVSKAAKLASEEMLGEKAVWRLVMRYATASDLGQSGAA